MGGAGLPLSATFWLLVRTNRAILIGNQEVAYGQQHREGDRTQGLAITRVAENDPRLRVWPMVSGQARCAICARSGLARPHHLSRLRTHQVGSGGAEDGARTAVFIHLAPLRRRSDCRLRERANDFGRVQARTERRRYCPVPDRIWI